jgi:hypothetical protein
VRSEMISEGMNVVLGASRIETDPDALSILPHTWTRNKKH